jgi:hypothetical protein
MSICSPCTKTLPVLYCSDALHVADWIAGDGVDVFVWYRNTATGRTEVEGVTTGVDGKISVTFSNKMEGNSYDLWINTSEGAMNDKDSFYLPNTTTSVTCITVKFDRAYESGSSATVSESVIEAE